MVGKHSTEQGARANAPRSALLAGGQAYGLQVKGDSMHPAIRRGSVIVAEPGRGCVPGEYVVLVLADGRTMVRELVTDGPEEIVVQPVNGGEHMTVEKANVEQMHPVGTIVAASKWLPDPRANDVAVVNQGEKA